MIINEFWEIIEKGKVSEEPASVIRGVLEKISPAEIASFQEYFDKLHEQAYHWKLWGAAHVIGDGCSDDGFIDFRYGLISRGKEIYEKAIKDPDSLAHFVENTEIQNEPFAYIAQELYEEITGSVIPRIKFNGLTDPSGVEWDFDNKELTRQHLPKLAGLYL